MLRGLWTAAASSAAAKGPVRARNTVLGTHRCAGPSFCDGDPVVVAQVSVDQAKRCAVGQRDVRRPLGQTHPRPELHRWHRYTVTEQENRSNSVAAMSRSAA